MSINIEVKNDKTGAKEDVQGSDGRFNTSSRSDSRAYYNSRDKMQTYTAVYDHQSAVAAEQSVYMKNTSESKTLVLTHAGLNAEENCRVRLCFVSGTAAGGSEVTPTNTNKSSSFTAAVEMRQGESGDAITGLTSLGCVDFAAVPANGHTEFLLGDTIRLGQNDAVAIEYTQGTTGDFYGVIGMFFE